MLTWTEAFASVVPVKLGVLIPVMLSVALNPVSVVRSSDTTGASVSKERLAAPAPPPLPAASV